VQKKEDVVNENESLRKPTLPLRVYCIYLEKKKNDSLRSTMNGQASWLLSWLYAKKSSRSPLKLEQST
jgi:hypothetical protein